MMIRTKALAALLVALAAWRAAVAEGAKPADRQALLAALDQMHEGGGDRSTDGAKRTFAAWAETEKRAPASKDALKAKYAQLGADAFADREAASKAILALGPAAAGELSKLVKAEEDPEVRVRAEKILKAWLKKRANRAVRLNNMVQHLWQPLPPEQKIQYAELLVDAILRLPAEVRVGTDRQGRFQAQALGWKMQGPPMMWQGRFGRMRHRMTVRRDDLLKKVASGLISLNTPAANKVLLRFLRKANTSLVLASLASVGNPNRKGVDAAPELIRLARGDNRKVALKALSCLSNWSAVSRDRKEITAALKALCKSKDPEIALQAAIVTCYSGDWSGFPLLLAATKSRDPKLRYKAVAQLVDSRFHSRSKEVAPALEAQLAADDARLVERAIESLSGYPVAAKRIIPFLDHTDRRIVRRAAMSLGAMGDPAAIGPLEKVLLRPLDQSARQSIDEALRRIRRKMKGK